MHVLVPALAPAAVVGLYFTPVSLVGCANRGYAALAVVFLSLLGGIAAAVTALRTRPSDRQASALWALSAAILALPALLVLGPLG
jgi:hypothetical protein